MVDATSSSPTIQTEGQQGKPRIIRLTFGNLSCASFVGVVFVPSSQERYPHQHPPQPPQQHPHPHQRPYQHPRNLSVSNRCRYSINDGTRCSALIDKTYIDK